MFKLHNERNRSENPIEDYKPPKCACNSKSHVNHFTFTTMVYLLTLTLSNSFKVYKHQNCNMHAKIRRCRFSPTECPDIIVIGEIRVYNQMYD